MVFVADRAVVKPRIEEEFGRDILVEIKGEGILPLPLRVLVGGEAIHACLIGDVLGDGPFQIDGELRTEVVQSMLSFLQTVSLYQRRTLHILEIISERSEVYSTREFLIASFHIVIHTE